MVTRARLIRSGETADLSFMNEVIRMVLAKRGIIYVFVGTAFVLSTVVMLLTPNKYTASAQIMPSTAAEIGSSGSMAKSMAQGSATLSSLLTSELGSMSPVFVELLKGRTVLDSVLTHEYTTLKEDRGRNLFELWNVENAELARTKLLSRSRFDSDTKTGIVEISVETKDPDLSAQICNEFVKQLDIHKQSLDRAMAGEISHYLTEQVALQKRAVEKAEQNQESFYAGNRNYMRGDDPKLKLQVERHDREVMFQRQVLVNLMELRARSDMEHEKGIPRISVLEVAEPPHLKSGPHRIKTVLMVSILACAFAIGLIALKVSYEMRISQATKAVLEESYQSVGKDLRIAARRMRIPLHSIGKPEA